MKRAYWIVILVVLVLALGLGLGLGLGLPKSEARTFMANAAINSEKTNVSEKRNTNINVARESYSYFLAALVIAKNESMVIEEFLEHYQSEGFDHVFLIDNGSTDDFQAKVKPFIDSKFVTLHYMPAAAKQSEHYNRVYNTIRDQCQWLAIVDVDEYVYGVNEPLVNLFRNEFARFHKVFFHWLMFGSNGHQTQPASIREGFTQRGPLPDGHTKCIFRTKFIDELSIHDHWYSKDYLETNVPQICVAPHHLARLNHYAIMSWDYFRTVKMTRGDVSNPKFHNFRNANYFAAYDENGSGFEDLDLANKVRKVQV